MKRSNQANGMNVACVQRLRHVTIKCHNFYFISHMNQRQMNVGNVSERASYHKNTRRSHIAEATNKKKRTTTFGGAEEKD